jgi:hypothetical protein
MPSLKDELEKAMKNGYERSHRKTEFISHEALKGPIDSNK